jgi:hypothetical protein
LTTKYSCLPDRCGQGAITRVSTYLAVQIRRTSSVSAPVWPIIAGGAAGLAAGLAAWKGIKYLFSDDEVIEKPPV